MINQMQSIPTIVKGIVTGALVITMLFILSPITTVLLNLLPDGTMMKYAAVLGYYLVIIFITWVLLWVNLFKVKEVGTNG